MHTTAKRLYHAAISSGSIPGNNQQAETAKLLNISAQRLNNWESRGISKAGMLMAQKAMGVSAYWIETGDGEMWAGGQMPVDPDEVVIQQYDTGGKGGTGLILRDQPGVIKHWRVDSNWIMANVPHCTSPANLCIVTGFGDSMPDTYNPGDPVLVDVGLRSCDHDGVYFFRIENEGFIKRLQRIPGQGIRVLSQNKEYEPWTITKDMDFEVFGKVLKAWKGKVY